MGRDLLYKPGVPLPLGDEASSTKKKPGDEKLGVKVPTARDLGESGARAPSTKATPAPEPVVARTTQEVEAKRAGAPAFRAAYFNEDTSGIGRVNLRSSRAAAMRGQEGASDLRQVVIPRSHTIDTPDPGQLRHAGDLMGLDGAFSPSLEGLLERQGQWLQAQGVTVEAIRARQAELERMVADRRRALERMRGTQTQRSVAVRRAKAVEGQGMSTRDVVGEGTQMVHDTVAGAEGMHARIAKALGIKRQK